MQHHEVGTAGQAEIDMRFDTLSSMADKLMLYKYVDQERRARAAGKTVTFMPKPLFQDNGSGMHVHQSLWKGGEPLFFDEKGYAGLSDLARWYIGGLLKHAPSLLAFTNPTTNSYKRLVPGYEAPVNLVYSQRNRSAAVRIPLYSKSPKAKRLEFRCPDPSCNPYLAFSALLMAGLDGIQNRIEPPDAARPRPLRPPARGAGEGAAGAGLARRGARRARGRPRVPARGRRVHARRDRDVDRVQARERGRRHAPPPAPVGVLPLLRHLALRHLVRAVRERDAVVLFEVGESYDRFPRSARRLRSSQLGAVAPAVQAGAQQVGDTAVAALALDLVRELVEQPCEQREEQGEEQPFAHVGCGTRRRRAPNEARSTSSLPSHASPIRHNAGMTNVEVPHGEPIPERARVRCWRARRIAFMTTMRPDGRMSTNPVAVMFDGAHLRVSTTSDR